MRPVIALLATMVAVCAGDSVWAVSGETVLVTVRGRSVPLTLYMPSASVPQRGTVIMGSGDVGWVGLAVTASEFLVERGYVVAGVNVRRYLSTFTSGTGSRDVDQIAQDYRTFAQYPEVAPAPARPGDRIRCLRRRGARRRCGCRSANHDWVDGVLTMGLPPTAELAWHWSDFATWITGKTRTSRPSRLPT